ncbi:MAG: hypothetical protein JW803_06205 [Endomicrobiales bacterium]|nr:hypothetical protein [Endomicrobiales bacterium]
MKKYSIFLLFCLACLCRFADAQVSFASGALPLVDGVYNSTSVVITSRQPVFSWEYSGAVSSFTIIVSADNVFSSGGELWNYVGGTTTANTINFITRVPYDDDGTATALSLATKYYWQVMMYHGSSSAGQNSEFTTESSAASLPGSKLDIAVDWNNPFDPVKNQMTKFRFTAKDRDRKVQVKVYSVSGELVREWGEMTALQDAWYTIIWDGKNSDGETVAAGIYLVNLVDVGEKIGVTKRVAVIKSK